MKHLLLISLIFLSISAKAQTSLYHPFPEDSATWTTDIYYNTCFGYCSSIFYQLKGDTIINSQPYNKIYKREGEFYYINVPPNPVVGNSFSTCIYIGAVRQDIVNKKVYFRDTIMVSDTLLYDFDLAAGDTIRDWYNTWYMPWPLIISDIDSVSINGSYHKRFNLQGYPFDKSLIEGVGWSGELFGVNITSALFTALACFNGNIIIQEAFMSECSVPLNCNFSSGTEEQAGKVNFSLFPNPFIGTLDITIDINELSEIIIYDITSKILIQKYFINSVTLNTEQLSEGLYLYEIRSKSGWRVNGTVVKYSFR